MEAVGETGAPLDLLCAVDPAGDCNIEDEGHSGIVIGEADVDVGEMDVDSHRRSRSPIGTQASAVKDGPQAPGWAKRSVLHAAKS